MLLRQKWRDPTMSEPLPIPAQLQHLIEKRTAEENRKTQRRTAAGDDKPPVEPQPSHHTPTPPGRRSGKERRQSIRRQADQ
jgi:hypothetical protein